MHVIHDENEAEALGVLIEMMDAYLVRQDVGAVTEYTFSSVTGDHSLYVVFRAEEATPPPTDTPPVITPPASATDILA